MGDKSGITMLSIVLYVFLFFTLMVFAISISTNMNYKVLTDKGDIYVNEQFSKLQYNLFKSAKNSNFVNVIGDKIVFSNNDEYLYDKTKRIIYKNGGILVNEVDDLSLKQVTEPSLIDSSKYISYSVMFSKYKETLKKDLFISVGD